VQGLAEPGQRLAGLALIGDLVEDRQRLAEPLLGLGVPAHPAVRLTEVVQRSALVAPVADLAVDGGRGPVLVDRLGQPALRRVPPIRKLTGADCGCLR